MAADTPPWSAGSQSESVFRLDTEEMPANVVAEVRFALDMAALRYPGNGRVTIDAQILRAMLDALEDYAVAEDGLDKEHEELADKKAERIRKVLAEHQAKYPRTDAVSESQADAVKELATAVDNLLDDL